MDITGEERIAASRDKVWAALNNPALLCQCIPGCETLEWTSPTELVARVKIKIGPLSASFAGNITLSNVRPPESYRIAGEGSGGIAGFARGAADVRLIEDGEETVLIYVIDAQVGGKLAVLGSRLVGSSARKLASRFFEKMTMLINGQAMT